MTAARASDRRTELARIHILAKDLAIGRDEYENLVFSLTRSRSAGDLDSAGRPRVIEHLTSLERAYKSNQREKSGYGKRPAVAPDREAQLGKLEALLAAAGRPWAYLESARPGRKSMVHRLCGVDALRFCTPEQLGKLIAALEYDRRRHAAKADA